MTVRAAGAAVLSLVLALLPAGQAAAHGGPHRQAPRKTAPVVTTGPGAAAPKTGSAAGAAGAASAQPGLAGAPAAASGQPAAGQAAPAYAEEESGQFVLPLEDTAAPLDPIEAAQLFDNARPRSFGENVAHWTGVEAAWNLLRYPVVASKVSQVLDLGLDPRKRAKAALALGGMHRPETVEALSAAAHDEHPLVARAARRSLLQLGVPLTAKPYEPPHYEFEDAKRPVHMAALRRVIAVGALFAAVEIVGSQITGSSSLMADAMHLTADMFVSLGALFALWAGSKKPDGKRTFGFLKMEPIVGMISAVLIPALAIFAGHEAWSRFNNPETIEAGKTALFALAGLAANGFSVWTLWKFQDDGVGVKGAFLHAAGDAMGSIGIIVAMGLVFFFGWVWADLAITALIIGLILKMSLGLMSSSWRMLIDAVPEHVDMPALKQALSEIPGVERLHDIHVWQPNSAQTLGTGKLNAKPGQDLEAIRQAAKRVFAEHGVGHVTVEVRGAAQAPAGGS